MQLAIIGLPVSGKTTIFNALTGGGPRAGSGGRPETRTAVVDVPDDRLDALAALYPDRKTVYAKVTYVDLAGHSMTAGRDGLPGPLLNTLSQMDGFVHVVRAFEDPLLPHPAGSVDPKRDLAAMEGELLLNDMIAVERRLDHLTEERQKGGRDKAVVERELTLFRRLAETLSQDKPLREMDFGPEEQRTLAGFTLLTLKPILVVLNLSEGQAAPEPGPAGPRSAILGLQGKLEMEIAQLPAEEVPAFLEEYGIEEAGPKRVVRASYDLLSLQTFFTIGDDEVRAWRLRRGGTALEAAAAVHTDLARGFIRAEVIAWDELLRLGSLAEARIKGKLRLEGKDYALAEGEVVYIRFNL